MEGFNKSRLFNASCVALIVTAMTFAIRAGILSQLGLDFGLNDRQLGWVNAMAFLGFPIATMIGGPLYNALGPKKIMYVAFVSHILGLLLTITAGGFWGLVISTFFIGFANGSVEAACNPMIADMYDNNKTTMLNKFHVWFPGGIVIGSLVSLFMTKLGMGWQAQIGIMLIPTLIYAWMFMGQKFPASEEEGKGFDWSKLFPPLYLTIVILLVLVAASDLTLHVWFGEQTGNYLKLAMLAAAVILVYRNFGLIYAVLALCMSLTATSELGTQQWVERILGDSGASPMIVLAMVTGLMAVGRYFGGPLIHKFKPIGVLFGSAIVATIGILLMSQATGVMVYVSAVMFAAGVCYFWPTMIGSTAEYTSTGAIGMSFMGGVGMFATSIWQPIIGGWLDSERSKALATGLDADAADLAAGQATLDNIAFFPAILIIMFGILYFMLKSKGKLTH